MRRKYGKILCIFLSSILLTLIGIARGDDDGTVRDALYSIGEPDSLG